MPLYLKRKHNIFDYYSLSPNWTLFSVAEDEDDDEGEELGGLFRVSRPDKSKKQRADATDCSRFHPDSSRNWDLEEVKRKSTKKVSFLSIFKVLWVIWIYKCDQIHNNFYMIMIWYCEAELVISYLWKGAPHHYIRPTSILCNTLNQTFISLSEFWGCETLQAIEGIRNRAFSHASLLTTT